MDTNLPIGAFTSLPDSGLVRVEGLGGLHRKMLFNFRKLRTAALTPHLLFLPLHNQKEGCPKMITCLTVFHNFRISAVESSVFANPAIM